MQNGIYFDLAEDAYLAIERLSKSGIKKLRISPADFWADSWLNPNREELTPEQEASRQAAKVIGRAYHVARLEPASFEARYFRNPSKAEFAAIEGFLHNGDGIKAELEKRGLPKSSKDDAGVLGAAERLRDAGYEPPIWHIIEAEAAAERGARIGLAAATYDEIMRDGERLRLVEPVARLLRDGEPEVSILYDCPETGIAMKARIDWLGVGYWVELKTFANANGKNLMRAIFDAFAYNRYHIEAVSYLQALEAAKALPIVGEASDAQRGLIARLQLADVEPECHFIFQQKGGVPNVLSRRFRFWQSSAEDALAELEADGASAEHIERARHMAGLMQRTRTMVHRKAALEIAAAKRDFLAYQELYERGEPWLPFDHGGEISDLDFTKYWLEELD